MDGAAGEDQALEYLTKKGLVLVERNFRCKGGEIDLILQQDAMLVFVEVRKRSHMHYGGAAASVGRQKQARLISAAGLYLQRYRHPPPCRFDVVAIDQNNLDWIPDAFQA
jgi:putative endonuclease